MGDNTLTEEGDLGTKIQAILTEYAALTGSPVDGSGGEELTLFFGQREQNDHADFPQVCWIETGGSFEDARGASGVPVTNDDDEVTDEPEALGAWVDLEVEVWRETGAECRDTIFNLVAAAKNVIDRNDLRWAGYDRVADRHLDHGHLFRLRMSIRLSVPFQGTEDHPNLTPIETHYGEFDDDENVNVDG